MVEDELFKQTEQFLRVSFSTTTEQDLECANTPTVLNIEVFGKMG